MSKVSALILALNLGAFDCRLTKTVEFVAVLTSQTRYVMTDKMSVLMLIILLLILNLLIRGQAALAHILFHLFSAWKSMAANTLNKIDAERFFIQKPLVSFTNTNSKLHIETLQK